MNDIIYSISMFQSKYRARHHTKDKAHSNPKITVYIATFTRYILDYIEHLFSRKEMVLSKEDAFFYIFLDEFIYSTLIERICLECRLNNNTRVERGLGKVRINGRCKPYKKEEIEYTCKMDYITERVTKALEVD